VATQPSAVTPRRQVQVQIAAPLFEPHPPTSTRQPRDHDLRQSSIGSTGNEVDRDLNDLPTRRIEPPMHRDWQPVDPYRSLGTSEGHIVRRVAASFRPVQRPGQQNSLRRLTHDEAREKQHAIEAGPTHRARACFDYSTPHAGQAHPRDAADRVRKNIRQARHPARDESELEPLDPNGRRHNHRET